MASSPLWWWLRQRRFADELVAEIGIVTPVSHSRITVFRHRRHVNQQFLTTSCQQHTLLRRVCVQLRMQNS